MTAQTLGRIDLNQKNFSSPKPTQKVEGKENPFENLGRWLIIGMSLGVVGSIGSVLYGLALRVSTIKPACAFLVIAVTSGMFGDLFITYGKKRRGVDFNTDPDGIEKFSSFFLPTPTSGQPPGLKNVGDICFINSALQSLFALPPYRAALLKTAYQECSYYTAWLKFYEEITSKQDAGFNTWSQEEIKGVLICLARMSEASSNNFTTFSLAEYLSKAGLMDSLFTRKIEEFRRAHIEVREWPDICALSDTFIDVINALKKESTSQQYFDILHPHHFSYQETFQVLQETIKNYGDRETLLQGNVTQLNPEDVNMPDSIQLKYLRKFLPGQNLYNRTQEDAEEFITHLLGWIRKCDYPEIFASPHQFQYLAKFTTEDPDLAHKVRQKRLEKKRTDCVPNDRIISHCLPSLTISLPCPDEEGLSGQDLINKWIDCANPFEEESERANNLFYYQEGDYYVTRERHRFDQLPPYLIVQLKRFLFNPLTNTRKKVDMTIHFPEEVELQGAKYRVVAITVHHGYYEGGHYTALIRDRNNDKWWYCNDEQVSPAQSRDLEIGLGEGYLYFLERIDER